MTSNLDVLQAGQTMKTGAAFLSLFRINKGFKKKKKNLKCCQPSVKNMDTSVILGLKRPRSLIRNFGVNFGVNMA